MTEEAKRDFEIFLKLMISWDTPEWEKNRAEFVRLMELDEATGKVEQGQKSPAMGPQAVAGLATNRSH